MKKFFVLAVLVIFMMAAAQANNGDTLNAGKITYQPTIGGKVITIAKGDTAVLNGVDSLVTIKTVTNSELVKVYVDGKVKLTCWVKSGYTSSPDPADTTGVKKIYQVIGGDEDGPESDSFPLGLVIFSAISILSFFGWLWWKLS